MTAGMPSWRADGCEEPAGDGGFFFVVPSSPQHPSTSGTSPIGHNLYRLSPIRVTGSILYSSDPRHAQG